MPIIDQLPQLNQQAQANAPDVGPQLHEGLQTGLELAARKAQLEQFKAEMDFKHQQLEQQKQEHMTSLFDQAVKEDDPTLRKVRLNQMQSVGNAIGYPIPDDTIDAVHKSDALREKIMSNLSSYKLMGGTSDTGQTVNAIDERARLSHDLLNAGMGGAGKLAEFVDKLAAGPDKLQQAQVLAGGHAIAPREAGFQKRINDVLPFVTSVDEANVLNSGPSDPRFLDVFGRAAAAYGVAETRKLEDQHKNLESEAKHRANEDVINRLRVKLQVSKEAQAIGDGVATDTHDERKVVSEVARIRGLLTPTKKGEIVNSARLALAITAMDKAVSGSSRLAATVYNGTKIEDKFTNIKVAASAWMPGKGNDIPVPDSILKSYRQMADAMQEVNAKLIKSKAAPRIERGLKNGLIDKDGAQLIAKRVLDPDSDEFFKSIGVNVQNPDGNKKVPSPAFLNAIMHRADVNGDKNKAKTFLDKTGFDSSGVQ